MNVQKLIEELSKYPSDLKVGVVFDGAHRMDIQNCWLSRKGDILVGSNDAVYCTEDRPSDAPTTEENEFWEISDGTD